MSNDPLPLCPKPEAKVRNIPEFSLPTQNRRPSLAHGIDVSHYQGTIDWEEVAQDGNVTYAYLKATESHTLTDKTYRRNLEGCKRNNIPVGAYHFFSPTADAHRQLRNFFSVVHPSEQDLIPIVDVEIAAKRDITGFKNRLKTFLKEVEKRFGTKPLLYTSVNFYHKYLMQDFSDYRYMIARYDEVMPRLNDEMQYIMWQYTQSGRIRGIRGNVDRSCFIHPHRIEEIRYEHK